MSEKQYKNKVYLFYKIFKKVFFRKLYYGIIIFELIFSCKSLFFENFAKK